MKRASRSLPKADIVFFSLITTFSPLILGRAEDIHATLERAEELAKGGKYVPGLRDLTGLERIWLLYWCDRAALEVSGLVVRPYLDNTPRGVFATRAPTRPNPIGLSPVRLLKVRRNILTIRDVDILDGTPLLDVKPDISRFDSFRAVRSGWLDEAIGARVVADNRFEKKIP